MKMCHLIGRAVLFVTVIFALTACASQLSLNKPVYFPPEPNLPRLQYLGGISDSFDVTGERQSLWSLFSVGQTQAKRALPILRPSGLAARGGKLFIADLSGLLYVVDLPKKTMVPLTGNAGPGRLKKPVGLAVNEEGYLFVADTGRREVLIYNGKGEYLKSIGAGLDLTPTHVAIYDKLLYILDTRKSVIQVVDPITNEVLRKIGEIDDQEKCLSLPVKMTIDKQGIIRVTNAGRGDVTSYDRDGHYLGSFGKFGDGFGQFTRPKGITSDANGYLYVVDSGFQNVQIFDETGRLLVFFGSGDNPVGGMNLPSDVAILSDDLPYYQTLADKDFELSQIVFVANQFGDPKISMYGLGKKKGIDYEKSYQEWEKEREEKARKELSGLASASAAVPRPSAPGP